MMISSHRDIREVVAQMMQQYPCLRWESGKHHGRLRNTHTQDFVPVPFTPSDFRAAKNLRAQLRRLGEYGEGLIAAKRAH